MFNNTQTVCCAISQWLSPLSDRLFICSPCISAYPFWSDLFCPFLYRFGLVWFGLVWPVLIKFRLVWFDLVWKFPISAHIWSWILRQFNENNQNPYDFCEFLNPNDILFCRQKRTCLMSFLCSFLFDFQMICIQIESWVYFINIVYVLCILLLHCIYGARRSLHCVPFHTRVSVCECVCVLYSILFFHFSWDIETNTNSFHIFVHFNNLLQLSYVCECGVCLCCMAIWIGIAHVAKIDKTFGTNCLAYTLQSNYMRFVL